MDFKDELATLKIRYKKPDGKKSKLIVSVVENEQSTTSSDNFVFSAAVAEFGLLIRDSEFKGEASFDQIIAEARDARGKDQEGYRAEFIRLVMLAQDIK